MSNTNSTHVNIKADDVGETPRADAPVSAAEAFAKSCEELKDDDEETPPPPELGAEVIEPECAQPSQALSAEAPDGYETKDFRANIAAKVNFSSCFPQIAIKVEDNHAANADNTQVVLLNGNWDISSDIPSIDAEMHNVNLEELQVLKGITMMSDGENVAGCSGTGMGGKQMKLDGYMIDVTSRLSSGVSSSNSTFMGTPSPLGSDSGIEGDSTDGNLSWLLNYKINELPPVPEQQQNVTSTMVPPMVHRMNEPIQPQMISVDPNLQYHEVNEHGDLINLQSKTYTTLPPHPKKMYVSNAPISSVAKLTDPKKPPFTYTELIQHALLEKRELTVSGIYQWISDHFPFYKQNDDRWKNSVRHNLSINPHFRKGSKAVHGAGHLWTIAEKDDHQSWHLKGQKIRQFLKSGESEKQQDLELANATASILPSEPVPPLPAQAKHMQPEDVAIEYVIDMSGGLGEQVVEECGLTGDYLITDLHPSELGLNMTDTGELLHAENLYDDLNFQSYELQGE